MAWALSTYLAATPLLSPLAAPYLRRRLAQGREEPGRWPEKLGRAGAARPEGRLVWLHAVGLGEVLALRGLIAALAEAVDAGAQSLSFLVTSSTRASASVFGANLPAATEHQFLPLDLPGPVTRFLDHWRPDLSIWAEQDIWPRLVVATDRFGVPLALVNARMNAESHQRRHRFRGLYRDLYGRFDLVAAQDSVTACNLTDLGARDVRVTGSLKAAAPALAADPRRLAALREALQGRKVWLLASAHAEDEAVALRSARTLSADPARLLVIVPREPVRGASVEAAARAMGLVAGRSGAGAAPDATQQVFVDDAFGTLGLWYRLAPQALIGGTFDAVEGHNPWEAAALGAAILHGPRCANFAADFAELDLAGGAVAVTEATLAATLGRDLAPVAARASVLSRAARGALVPLARDLRALMR